MPAGDHPNYNFVHCWSPYGWYPLYTPTITVTTNLPKSEPDDRCPKGKHHYVRAENPFFGSRLLIYCELCGDVVEYPQDEAHE